MAEREPLSGNWGGRIGIVTGGAKGIGAAIAQRLAAWGAAGLILTDRDAEGGAATAAAIAARGTPCHFVAADLAHPEAAAIIVAEAERRFGRLDGLVNAAGLTDRGTILDADAALFDRMMAVNARAPFLLIQAAAKLMIAGGQGGAIVNILSMNALVGSPKLSVYSVSKGAALTLTKNAAHSLKAHRIRVNGINLGWADTPTEDLVQRREHPAGAEWRAAAGATQPFGRLVGVEDVADLAAYLLSDHAGVMTGAVIDHEQWVAGAPP